MGNEVCYNIKNNLAVCLKKPIVGADAHIGPQNLMRFKRSDVGIASYTISFNLCCKLLFTGVFYETIYFSFSYNFNNSFVVFGV